MHEIKEKVIVIHELRQPGGLIAIILLPGYIAIRISFI